jgi:hypothetical protein
VRNALAKIWPCISPEVSPALIQTVGVLVMHIF